jgi:hypothetical protein
VVRFCSNEVTPFRVTQDGVAAASSDDLTMRMAGAKGAPAGGLCGVASVVAVTVGRAMLPRQLATCRSSERASADRGGGVAAGPFTRSGMR